MKTNYEVRFVYPVVERVQTLLPGVDARMVDPKRITQKVVPEDGCGHIEVRSSYRNTKGELCWGEWRRMCKSGSESQIKTSKTHLAGREVCQTCQKNYRAHGEYPEVQLLTNWEVGGHKIFGL